MKNKGYHSNSTAITVNAGSGNDSISTSIGSDAINQGVSRPAGSYCNIADLELDG